MPEILGEGFIQILPDTAQFNTALQAEVTASLSAVEKQFAATKFNFPTAQNPFTSLEKGAASAATAVSQNIGAALKTLETQLASLGTKFQGGVFPNLQNQVKGAANAINGQGVPAVKKIGDEANTAGKKVEDAGKSVGGFQRQLLALTRLAPLIAAGFSVKVFADFEKAAATAAVVFGDSSNEIIDFARNLDSAFRISATSAVRFAADFGTALVNIGFGEKTAADAAKELTLRSADVAAALKQSPDQIAKAFDLALEGNTRGLKTLGITISAVDQQNKALQLGFHGTVSELSDAQRATVNYELILEKTAKFQGQAAATADTLAGRIGEFKTSASNAALAVGQSLAPALEGVLAVLSPIFDFIKGLPKPLLAFASAAATAGLALKVLSSGFVVSAGAGFLSFLSEAAAGVGLLVTELVTLGEVGTAAGLALDSFGGPLALIAGAVGVAVAAFEVFKTKSHDVGEALRNLGKIALDSTEAFKAITGVDFDKFNADLNTINAAGLGAGQSLDLLSLRGQDLKDALDKINRAGGNFNQIALDIKNVGKAFTDLLDPKNKLGAAGIGAAAGQLQVLRAAGQDNTEAFRKMQAQLDAAIAAVNAFNAAEQAGEDILNADSIAAAKNTAQIQAQTEAITDLFKVTGQLQKAQRELDEAKKDQIADQAKLNALILEGGKQEKAEAQTKLAEAHDSVTAALERQAIAQKKLDELNAEDFDRKLAEAANAVTEAQIGLREAIKARDDAEKALNKTSLTGLNLTGLNLNQLRTALANARLTLAANREAQKGKTQQELQDDLTSANIAVFDATNKVNDAKKEQNKLITEGKNGTDEHIAAVHELTLAVNAVTKAQDEVNKRQGELDKILAGNSQHAKDIAAATKTVREDNDKIADAQKTISGLVNQQKVDTSIIAGDQDSITNSLKTQATILDNLSILNQNPTLRRSLIENFLQANGATTTVFNPENPAGTVVPFLNNELTQKAIDDLFNALKNNPARFRELLLALGIAVPGFAEGGVITRPNLAWIGEKFKAESVLPWSKPDRVWEVLSQSLPHMPAMVRQRIEPAIPGRSLPRTGAGGALSGGMTEEQLHRTIRTAMLEALKEVGSLGADVDITVMPPQGLSEAQVARRVAREMSRYWGTP